jgi:L-ascorbate metabolism protein UlaG (beta-lactamase superfamily)
MHEIQVPDSSYTDPTNEAFYKRRMAHMINEFAQPVTEGVRIWMMYNHGFVVRSPSGTIAFDLRDDTPSWGPEWTYELPPTLLDQIDILFISHEHEDHWQDRVAIAVRAAGGDVVYPAEPWTVPLENYGNVPMADLDTVTLSGFDITAYFGQHSAPNRIYEVTTPEGIRIMHTGDTQDPDWIPEAGPVPVDILLINGWIHEGDDNSTIGMINAITRVKPRFMIPGHYARFAGYTEYQRTIWSYPAAMAVPAGLPAEIDTEVAVLLWGERFDYVTDPESRLSRDLSWLFLLLLDEEN